MTDVRSYQTRRETACVHCSKIIPPGTMVHIVTDDAGRPRAAHVECDIGLRREARGA